MKLSNCKFPKRLSYEDWICTEQFTYQVLFQQGQEIIEQKQIHDFYFLGDLLFGVTSIKEFNSKRSLLEEHLSVFLIFFLC